MKDKRRFKVLAGVLLMLVIVAVIVSQFMRPTRPAPSENGYYTGPMVNKARTLIVDDNGKIYGPAPADTPKSAVTPAGVNKDEVPPNSSDASSGK